MFVGNIHNLLPAKTTKHNFGAMKGGLLKYFLFSIVLLFAAYKRFSLPLEPIPDPDLYGYIGPALSFFKGDGFIHMSGRSFLYPLLMLVLLAITKAFSAISIFQHLVGLASGFALFKIWDLPVIKQLQLPTWLHLPFQLGSTTFFLLSTPLILLEHSIRPESLAIALIVAIIYILAKSLTVSHTGKRLKWLSALFFANLFLFVLFPRWGFALPIMAVVLLLEIYKLDISLKHKALHLGVAVSLFAFCVYIPERVMVNKMDPETDEFLAKQFFYVHADIIADIMIKDLADTASVENFTKKNKKKATVLINAVNAHRDFNTLLGFNSDGLMYGPTEDSIYTFPKRLLAKIAFKKLSIKYHPELEQTYKQLAIEQYPDLQKQVRKSRIRFYKHYNSEVFFRSPWKYSKKTINQLCHYYAPPLYSGAVYLTEFISKDVYTLVPPDDMVGAVPFFSNYLASVNSLSTTYYSGIVLHLNRLGWAMQYSFLPLLILSLIISTRRFYKHKHLSPINRLVVWLILLHFGLVLTVATIHSFDNGRYAESIYPINIITYFVCLAFLFHASRSSMLQSTGKDKVTVRDIYLRVKSILLKTVLRVPVLVTLCALLIIYAVASHSYYRTLQYPFEPFVQIGYNKYDTLVVADNDLIVLCLGGSTTNDGRLQESEKYPAQLEGILQAQYPHRTVRVLNGGMDWYTSKHSLINYTTYYSKFKPDAVVVMHAINDICRSFTPVDFSSGPYTDTYSHYYGPATNANKPVTMERHVLRKMFGDFTFQQKFNPHRSSTYDVDSFRSYNAYAFYMSQLLHFIKQDSIFCVFVEQPSFYFEGCGTEMEPYLWFGKALCNNGSTYPDCASMHQAMERFNSFTQTMCLENGIPFVETSPLFPKDTLHLKDDVHHTPKGAALLAKLVSQKLIEEWKEQ